MKVSNLCFDRSILVELIAICYSSLLLFKRIFQENYANEFGPLLRLLQVDYTLTADIVKFLSELDAEPIHIHALDHTDLLSGSDSARLSQVYP